MVSGSQLLFRADFSVALLEVPQVSAVIPAGTGVQEMAEPETSSWSQLTPRNMEAWQLHSLLPKTLNRGCSWVEQSQGAARACSAGGPGFDPRPGKIKS